MNRSPTPTPRHRQRWLANAKNTNDQAAKDAISAALATMEDNQPFLPYSGSGHVDGDPARHGTGTTGAAKSTQPPTSPNYDEYYSTICEPSFIWHGSRDESNQGPLLYSSYGANTGAFDDLFGPRNVQAYQPVISNIDPRAPQRLAVSPSLKKPRPPPRTRPAYEPFPLEADQQPNTTIGPVEGCLCKSCDKLLAVNASASELARNCWTVKYHIANKKTGDQEAVKTRDVQTTIHVTAAADTSTGADVDTNTPTQPSDAEFTNDDIAHLEHVLGHSIASEKAYWRVRKGQGIQHLHREVLKREQEIWELMRQKRRGSCEMNPVKRHRMLQEEKQRVRKILGFDAEGAEKKGEREGEKAKKKVEEQVEAKIEDEGKDETRSQYEDKEGNGEENMVDNEDDEEEAEADGWQIVEDEDRKEWEVVDGLDC